VGFRPKDGGYPARVSNQIADLERDIEQTRDQLAATIDELLYRTSPKTIASRQLEAVKARFVDPETGAPNTTNILVAVGSVVGVAALFVALRRASR
jgi:hypothetical protein